MTILPFCLFILLDGLSIAASYPADKMCEPCTGTSIPEGNFGQKAIFPWLGVLRTSHMQNTKSKPAVGATGIVLVKDNYCIVNAADLSTIPRLVLRDQSRAMFFPKDDEPWTSKVKEYVVHPDYDIYTLNSISLIELVYDDYRLFVPFHQICWPTKNFNVSNNLYTIGFTDENLRLDKVIYKTESLNYDKCSEFYSTAAAELRNDNPEVQNDSRVHMICGHSPRQEKHCEWDNGMALASNDSGKWVLIGFSLRGAGCRSPSRYLDMNQYLGWIERTTSMDEIPDDFRRSDHKDVELKPNETVDIDWLLKDSKETSKAKLLTLWNKFRESMKPPTTTTTRRTPKYGAEMNFGILVFEEPPSTTTEFSLLFFKLKPITYPVKSSMNSAIGRNKNTFELFNGTYKVERANVTKDIQERVALAILNPFFGPNATLKTKKKKRVRTPWYGKGTTVKRKSTTRSPFIIPFRNIDELCELNMTDLDLYDYAPTCRLLFYND